MSETDTYGKERESAGEMNRGAEAEQDRWCRGGQHRRTHFGTAPVREQQFLLHGWRRHPRARPWTQHTVAVHVALHVVERRCASGARLAIHCHRGHTHQTLTGEGHRRVPR
jgi:hypothetical protein